MEVQVEVKPKVSVVVGRLHPELHLLTHFLIAPLKVEARYSTELQHPVTDLRSAPIREHPPTTYASFTLQNRSTSLEPQAELSVHIQKPPTYQRSGNSFR